MILTLVSESTTEPVSVSAQKTYMRMESTDSTSEDTLIGDFITIARKQAENLTKRALVSQTWQYIIDDFDSCTAVIELPRAPLSTSSTNVSITYVKDTTAGDTTTIGSTVFSIDSGSEPGRIYPSYGNEWPSDVRDQRNAVTIQYVSGYTTSTTPIPRPIASWIKMRVLDLYENRESMSEERIYKINRDHMNGLLDPYLIKTIV
ncbi:MAG: hypothetical protein MJA29_04320 [Candidatus Omnitrophica bacterium]|nr:hypothetical protein [Candidatus Omnitrophota bacterium]